MVHTLTLNYELTIAGNVLFLHRIKEGSLKEKFSYIRENYRKLKQITYCAGYPPVSVFYNYTYHYINVTIDPSIVLEHNPVAADYEAIQQYCDVFIRDVLQVWSTFVKEVSLNRIDFNIDYKIKNEEEREIIYFLMRICRDDLYKVVRLSYKSAITYNPNEGWIEIITYDKEMQERQNYSYEDLIVLNEDDLEYVGIFRTEVRIKNAKLNYNKTASLGLEKCLSNYLCEDMKKFYWEKYAEKVWFTEDFYRLDKAIEIVKKSNLKDNMKKKLCTLLRKINKYGYSQARSSYKCKDTFKNHINAIRHLNINPLTFEKTFKLEKMENFAKYKSSTIDD